MNTSLRFPLYCLALFLPMFFGQASLRASLFLHSDFSGTATDKWGWAAKTDPAGQLGGSGSLIYNGSAANQRAWVQQPITNTSEIFPDGTGTVRVSMVVDLSNWRSGTGDYQNNTVAEIGGVGNASFFDNWSGSMGMISSACFTGGAASGQLRFGVYSGLFYWCNFSDPNRFTTTVNVGSNPTFPLKYLVELTATISGGDTQGWTVVSNLKVTGPGNSNGDIMTQTASSTFSKVYAAFNGWSSATAYRVGVAPGSSALTAGKSITIDDFIAAVPHDFAPDLDLSQVGMHPGGFGYWSIPYFANAMASNGSWLKFYGSEFGAGVSMKTAQFNADGYPQYLNADGEKLRAILYGLHATYSNRPASWPDLSAAAKGHVVLTWKGEADIRLNGGGTFLADESNGTSTGSIVNGRRVYRYDTSALNWLDIYAINQSNPITEIKVWLPDPSDPSNVSQEGRVFHSKFVDRVKDADWGYIRFMDWNCTNASPQQDWVDRRRPTHAFQAGLLNERSPVPGVVWYTDGNGNPVYFSGNRGTGVAFEHMVGLCNEAKSDLWINVPHLATDDFVYNLARLIRFGSDAAGTPYASTQSNPVYPPLYPNHKVYVEYSNEIWSNGDSFPQGNWAAAQGAAQGLTQAQWNARRFCQIWRIFQEVFGDTQRLVRVAAVWTAADYYTEPFLEEMASYGPTLSPAVTPDVIACTTYFGNGIHVWAHEKAKEMAGSSDPWFYTTSSFDSGGGAMRPVSVAASNSYWTSEAIGRHLDEAFDEWNRRILSGSAEEGAGPDATAKGGGFDTWLYDLAQTAFPQPVPLISYEGGPSMYTTDLDGWDSRDDGITTFVEALNRHPRFQEVYRAHLNLAKSKGLWAHTPYTCFSTWGRYGQWGHLEHILENPGEAPKYQALLDWAEEGQSLRPIEEALGNIPEFATDFNLTPVVVGQTYSTDITVQGGDGGRTVEVLSSHLAAGLQFSQPNGDTIRISGQTDEDKQSYLFARVVDGDGDASWRTFNLLAIGGPGTLVQSNFNGTNPAKNLPWTQAWILDSSVTFSGWTKGSGLTGYDGDNDLVYIHNTGDATLALSLSHNSYWSMTVTPTSAPVNLRKAEVQFNAKRIDYHAPRQFAVFTSVGGFLEGAQVFTSDYYDGTSEQEYRFTLPDTTAYENITGPFEIRIYGFAESYGWHKTSLTHFKLITAP